MSKKKALYSYWQCRPREARVPGGLLFSESMWLCTFSLSPKEKHIKTQTNFWRCKRLCRLEDRSESVFSGVGHVLLFQRGGWFSVSVISWTPMQRDGILIFVASWKESDVYERTNFHWTQSYQFIPPVAVTQALGCNRCGRRKIQVKRKTTLERKEPTVPNQRGAHNQFVHFPKKNEEWGVQIWLRIQ